MAAAGVVEDKSVQQMQAASARVLLTSPGLAEKLAGQGRSPGKPAEGAAAAVAAGAVGAAGGGAAFGGRGDERDAMIAELQRQLSGEKERARSLEDQYKFRVASFVKRETQTKNKVESLERRLNEGPEGDEHLTRMSVIENMHKSVVAGLEHIQINTAKILQDQEKDLMRAFRARLQEVSKDLEAQRARKGEHSTELQAKHRKVVAELHEAQELAQTFDRKNQQLATESQRLQERLRSRDDDRQALLRELVLSRKEASRLKAQIKESGEAEGGAGNGEEGGPTSPAQARRKSFSQRQLEQARLQQTHNRPFEREVSYRDAITKLKRLVEAERRTVRSLKNQQAELLQQRTELEVLLRQCLDDVKAEILRHRPASAGSAGASGAAPGASALQARPAPAAAATQAVSAISVHELGAQDRERVLELLLSQQRVVQLLYSRTFTHRGPAAAAGAAAGGGGPAPTPPEMEGEEPPSTLSAKPTGRDKEDDFAWLSDIIPP